MTATAWDTSLGALDAALAEWTRHTTGADATSLATTVDAVITDVGDTKTVVDGGAATKLNTLATKLTSLADALPYLSGATDRMMGRLDTVNSSVILIEGSLADAAAKLKDAQTSLNAVSALSPGPASASATITTLAVSGASGLHERTVLVSSA